MFRNWDYGADGRTPSCFPSGRSRYSPLYENLPRIIVFAFRRSPANDGQLPSHPALVPLPPIQSASGPRLWSNSSDIPSSALLPYLVQPFALPQLHLMPSLFSFVIPLSTLEDSLSPYVPVSIPSFFISKGMTGLSNRLRISHSWNKLHLAPDYAPAHAPRKSRPCTAIQHLHVLLALDLSCCSPTQYRRSSGRS